MTLTKQEITEFKNQLLQLRAKILRVLAGSEIEVRKPDEATGYSQHQADQGTDDFDRTISLELTTNEYELLKQIDRALEKIEENTYGKCDITGKPIPRARLKAVPYATLTVEAQEKMERERGLS